MIIVSTVIALALLLGPEVLLIMAVRRRWRVQIIFTRRESVRLRAAVAPYSHLPRIAR